MAEPRHLPAYPIEPLPPGPPNRQQTQIPHRPRRPETYNDSPRLLHKTEGRRPRDRNRNNARHPCQQLTDNDTVSPIGAERTESALTASAGPPNLSDLDQGHKIRGLLEPAPPPCDATMPSPPSEATPGSPPNRRVLPRVLRRVLRSLTWENTAPAPRHGYVLGGACLSPTSAAPPRLPPTVTNRGRARHSTTHTPPDPTQIRPTGAARQGNDGHADTARPPAYKAQPPGTTPLPQERPTHQTGQRPQDGKQANSCRDAQPGLHQTNGHRPPARSGDTCPHRRPPSGTRVLRVLRVLPRVLPRVLRSLTWGFTPPAATLESWSPTIPTFARRHRYPPPFTAVAAWSTALDVPQTASRRPLPAVPHPSGPATGSLVPPPRRGGLDRLGEARTPGGQPGRGRWRGFRGGSSSRAKQVSTETPAARALLGFKWGSDLGDRAGSPAAERGSRMCDGSVAARSRKEVRDATKRV